MKEKTGFQLFVEWITFRSTGILNNIVAGALWFFVILVSMSLFFDFNLFQELVDSVGMSYGAATAIFVGIIILISLGLHFLWKRLYGPNGTRNNNK
jgi:hypothetical protein